MWRMWHTSFRGDRKVIEDIIGYLERYKGEDVKEDLLEILRREDENDENIDFTLSLELLRDIKRRV